MPMTRAERVSIHKKQERMLLKDGVPLARELQEGVPTLRSTSEGVVEYVSYGGALYQNVFSKSTRTSVPVKSAFNATATANQTIADADTTQVTFSDTVYNLNDDFSVTGNIYIAPVSGIYSFYAQVMFDSGESVDFDAGERLDLTIYNVTDSVALGSGLMEATLDFPLNTYWINRIYTESVLTKGDYVRVHVYSLGVGADMSTYTGAQTPYSYFTGHLIQEV